MPAVAASPAARLEARISTDLHALLKHAELQGRTLTDFVMAEVQEAAVRAVEQAEVVRLSVADQRAFAVALICPPKPNAALKKAFKRREQLLSAG